VASMVSPLEVQIRHQDVCAACHTKDCIKGRVPAPDVESPRPLRGCELWLFQQSKVGNMDCTFCLDCAHACPHDNVGLSPRLPASELWSQARRSGIGYFSRRPDLAALVVVFTFGALLNAFAMVSPVYAVEGWLAGQLRTQSELPVLALLFVVGLLIVPAILMGLAGWTSKRLVPNVAPRSTRAWVTHYAYALVPLGFGIWLAHYGFHFLTGFWTVVPVVQSLVAELLGASLVGAPSWQMGPLVPMGWLYPLELGLLGLGWFGSLLVAYNLAERDAGPNPWRAFIPWAVLLTLLLASAIWLMGQPMEMRGTFLAG
jgi:hypothetical protein